MAFKAERTADASLEGNQRLLHLLIRLVLVLAMLNLAFAGLAAWAYWSGPHASTTAKLSLASTQPEASSARDYPLANRNRIELYADGVLQSYRPVTLSKAELWAVNQLVKGRAQQVEVVNRITYTNPGGLLTKGD